MPTIAFSDSFMSGSSTTFMGRFMAYNVQNNGSVYALLAAGPDGNQQGQAPAGQILLMKGTVPTDFSSLTSYSNRSADVLAQWNVGTRPGGNNFTVSTPNTNPAIISTTFVAATASGTATWFWWISRLLYSSSSVNPPYLNSPLPSQIVGTVGEVGSGSDLEISSTTITTNQLLRILNLRLQLPSTYTY